MRYIFFILMFVSSYANGQATRSYGATRDTDTSITKGYWKTPVYSTSDTDKVLGFDANGVAVLRSKASSTIDTSLFLKKSDTSRSGIVATYYYVDSLTIPLYDSVADLRDSIATKIDSSDLIGVYVNGGNEFGVNALLGTNDAFPLTIATNGNPRYTFSNGHVITLNGATPDDWSTSIDIVHQGSNTAMMYGNTTDLHLLSNAYFNASDVWTYQANGTAINPYLFNGEFVIRTAASGIAGNPVSWGTAFTIKNIGNVLAGSNGVDNGLGKLQVKGDAWIQGDININGTKIITGTGSPEGVESAGVGSVFLRSDGGSGTAIYIKESGVGNTGWTPFSSGNLSIYATDGGATYNVPETNGAYWLSFTGTTSTWTLPELANTNGGVYHIKNRGSGDLTINTNLGGNEIYNTSAINTIILGAGGAIILQNDGTYFNLE